jgi:hypothetical protein
MKFHPFSAVRLPTVTDLIVLAEGKLTLPSLFELHADLHLKQVDILLGTK